MVFYKITLLVLAMALMLANGSAALRFMNPTTTFSRGPTNDYFIPGRPSAYPGKPTIFIQPWRPFRPKRPYWRPRNPYVSIHPIEMPTPTKSVTNPIGKPTVTNPIGKPTVTNPIGRPSNPDVSVHPIEKPTPYPKHTPPVGFVTAHVMPTVS